MIQKDNVYECMQRAKMILRPSCRLCVCKNRKVRIIFQGRKLYHDGASEARKEQRAERQQPRSVSLPSPAKCYKRRKEKRNATRRIRYENKSISMLVGLSTYLYQIAVETNLTDLIDWLFIAFAPNGLHNQQNNHRVSPHFSAFSLVSVARRKEASPTYDIESQSHPFSLAFSRRSIDDDRRLADVLNVFTTIKTILSFFLRDSRRNNEWYFHLPSYNRIITYSRTHAMA